LLDHNAKTGFLDRGDETILSDGLWVIKDARLTFIERHGSHPHARLFFNQGLDCIGAAVAAHSFDFECDSFHRRTLFC